MRCEACAAPLPEEDRFCPRCGEAVPGREPWRAGRRVLAAGAAVVVAGIVAASLLVRSAAPADPVADVSVQRRAVERFHDLVLDGRWTELYPLVSEPPTADASSFAELMREQLRRQGRTVEVTVERMQLRRSRGVPLLEVVSRVTLARPAGERRERVRSFFLWHEGRWLFGFSTSA